MHAYAAAGWENFFVAEAGASAALAGLLFVAVSINLSRILAFPQLPGRAAEALIILVGVLVDATIGLVPEQPRWVLGAGMSVVGVTVWAYPILLQLRAIEAPGAPRRWKTVRILSHQVATVPMLVAGLSVLVGRGGGLYWLLPGTIFSFSVGLLNAWVLLVEIQR